VNQKSSNTSLMLAHMDTGVTFYHLNDERAFFEWLGRIPCVERYVREGCAGLVAYLKRAPRKDELRSFSPCAIATASTCANWPSSRRRGIAAGSVTRKSIGTVRCSERHRRTPGQLPHRHRLDEQRSSAATRLIVSVFCGELDERMIASLLGRHASHLAPSARQRDRVSGGGLLACAIFP